MAEPSDPASGASGWDGGRDGWDGRDDRNEARETADDSKPPKKTETRVALPMPHTWRAPVYDLYRDPLGLVEDIIVSLSSGAISRITVAARPLSVVQEEDGSGDQEVTVGRVLVPSRGWAFRSKFNTYHLRFGWEEIETWTPREIDEKEGSVEVSIESEQPRAEAKHSPFDGQEIETLEGKLIEIVSSGLEEGDKSISITLHAEETNHFHRVQLGPEKYVFPRGDLPVKGDLVEIEGVRSTDEQGDLWIARAIRVEGKEKLLRDTAGVPLHWGTGDKSDAGAQSLVSVKKLTESHLTLRDEELLRIVKLGFDERRHRLDYLVVKLTEKIEGMPAEVAVPWNLLRLTETGKPALDLSLAELSTAAAAPKPSETDHYQVLERVYGAFDLEPPKRERSGFESAELAKSEAEAVAPSKTQKLD